MCFILKPLIVDIWKAFTFNHCNGIVESSYFMRYKARDGYRDRDYPIIRFEDSNNVYTFFGRKELIGTLNLGDSVPVIFDSKDDGEAFVYTFSGFWIRHIGYLIPFTIAITLFFCLDVIPRKWIIKL